MSSDAPGPLVGLLNLNKPAGITSRDVVNRVGRLVRRVKLGHAGTLDPLATGVLVVCVGSATRLIEYVQEMPKTYRTIVRLGATSDTDDADGRVVEVPDAPIPTVERVREVLAEQVGAILQKPPEYSALKVSGRRAYDLARSGRVVDLAPRRVQVHRIDVIALEWPRLELEVHCGSGTYIRSIARDAGARLGCGGLVEVLDRTAIGPFRRDEAIELDALTAENLPGFLRPAAEAVSSLPVVLVSDEEAANLAQGRAILRPPEGLAEGEAAILGPDGRLVAIGEADPKLGRIAPRRVLHGG